MMLIGMMFVSFKKCSLFYLCDGRFSINCSFTLAFVLKLTTHFRTCLHQMIILNICLIRDVANCIPAINTYESYQWWYLQKDFYCWIFTFVYFLALASSERNVTTPVVFELFPRFPKFLYWTYVSLNQNFARYFLLSLSILSLCKSVLSILLYFYT